MTRFGHRRAAGLTLVELLVTVAMAAALVGLLLPAVQAARESARAQSCQTNLRQLALAVIMYGDARGALPPARHDGVVGIDSPGPVPGPTWLWTIRPFLESSPRVEWPVGARYAEVSPSIREDGLPLFLCPSRRSGRSARTETSFGPPRLAACGCMLPGAQVAGGAVSDYAGNQGESSTTSDFYKGGHGTGTIVASRVTPESFRPLDLVRPRDIRDGLSATLLIGEAHVRRDQLLRLPDTGPAYDGSQFQFTSRVGGAGVGIAAGPDDDAAGNGWMAFGSWHPAVCQVAWADARIGRLAPDTAPEIMASFCNRADGVRRADVP